MNVGTVSYSPYVVHTMYSIALFFNFALKSNSNIKHDRVSTLFKKVNCFITYLSKVI